MRLPRGDKIIRLLPTSAPDRTMYERIFELDDARTTCEVDEVKLNLDLEIHPNDLASFLQNLFGDEALAAHIAPKKYHDDRAASHHGEIVKRDLTHMLNQFVLTNPNIQGFEVSPHGHYELTTVGVYLCPEGIKADQPKKLGNLEFKFENFVYGPTSTGTIIYLSRRRVTLNIHIRAARVEQQFAVYKHYLSGVFQQFLNLSHLNQLFRYLSADFEGHLDVDLSVCPLSMEVFTITVNNRFEFFKKAYELERAKTVDFEMELAEAEARLTAVKTELVGEFAVPALIERCEIIKRDYESGKAKTVALEMQLAETEARLNAVETRLKGEVTVSALIERCKIIKTAHEFGKEKTVTLEKLLAENEARLNAVETDLVVSRAGRGGLVYAPGGGLPARMNQVFLAGRQRPRAEIAVEPEEVEAAAEGAARRARR